MNAHCPDIEPVPSREEAEAALTLVRKWAQSASREDIVSLEADHNWTGRNSDNSALSRAYPEDFRPACSVAS
jgi:GTP cyclohydrolase I